MSAVAPAGPARATRSPAGPAPAGEPAPPLRLTGVTRSHGDRPVWAPLDLTLLAGTLCVVTGPNGSGKTTLLRVAAGLARPTAGRRDATGRALYLRGGAGLRTAQTVRDAVRSTAALVGSPDADAALEALRLQHLAGRRVGTLSAGERVRAALAAAVAARPALLCLDEPTAALDETALHDLVGVLAAVRSAGAAVLVATHQPAVLLPVADAHLRVQDGRVQAA